MEAEVALLGVHREDLGVADGGQVHRARGVQAARVDQQLELVQRQRGVLPDGAGERSGREE